MTAAVRLAARPILDSDDEIVSEDEWRSKISEWEEKAESSTAQPHKFSGYVYKEDGTRIDDNSPVKLEDFLPPPGALPSFMKDVHGHMPPGERSMESMLTKMDLDEVEGLPPLEEILAVPAWEKAEAKRLAREKELKKQLEQAASRVRTVDEFGRSVCMLSSQISSSCSSGRATHLLAFGFLWFSRVRSNR